MNRDAPSYKVTTLGCRVNRADSNEIERRLSAHGLRMAPGEEVPDVWVVNTCAVTAEGTRKSRKLVRRCARSGAAVIATGCAVDMEPEAFEMDGVKASLPNTQKNRAADVAASLYSDEEQDNLVPHQWLPVELARVPVKVQDGCSRYCSYCIVPYLRPAPFSRSVSSVLEEVRSLCRVGVGEVIICGIDLGSYEDRSTGRRLAGLVEAVLQEAPGLWVRLSSVEMPDLDEDLLRLLAADNNLCRYLHLPLQSGSDQVLLEMNRGYCSEGFSRQLLQIRMAVPGISVSTDVMVGFPSEDDDAFLRTQEMVSRSGFSRAHVFKYSPRPGTAAYSRGDPVSPELKAERAAKLRKIAGDCALRFHQSFVGRIIPVLVEEAVRDQPGRVFARAESFAGMILEGDAPPAGSRVHAVVTSAGPECLRGTVAGKGPEALGG